MFVTKKGIVVNQNDLKFIEEYSGVPNNQAGSNKRAGWKFHGILIIEQAVINEQGGNFLKFQ